MNDFEFLKDGLRQIEIEASESSLKKLVSFNDILIEWNEKINLTTIIDKNEVYIKHFFDSATCLSTGYIKEQMKIIDVGTGAGFPGLPIRILKENTEVTLLDSLNKRINYLDDVVKRLDLKNIELVHARAEEGGINKKYREKYDIALSRAVAATNVLSEYCLPFLKVGGYFLCQKGPNYEQELDDARRAIELLGGNISEVKQYKLPYSDITHYVIIIQKIKPTPTKYPRKPGKPASDPIK